MTASIWAIFVCLGNLGLVFILVCTLIPGSRYPLTKRKSSGVVQCSLFWSQEENSIKQKVFPCSSPRFWAENNMVHIYRNSHLSLRKSCMQCAYEFPLSLKADTVKIV